MTHKCEHEGDIGRIKDDIIDIKKDVKNLLKFKWQIMGGAGVIGITIAAVINIFK